MKITLYVPDWMEAPDINDEIRTALKNQFETTKSEAREINGDDISRVEVDVKLGEIEQVF